MSATSPRTGPTLWWNPAAGVAGDMLLASLLAVGADQRHVRTCLATLPVDGWTLEVAATHRRGLVATLVDVAAEGHQHHRAWSTIDTMLADAALPPRVAKGARRTFEVLANAEARVHGIDVDDVHFHEVGAVDAIVDVVGVWAALDALGVEDVVAGPVGLGVGATPMAHGTIPVPAPATLELLTGLPSVPVDVAGETATPTGVALLATIVDRWGPPPSGTLRATGRGAGHADPDTVANVVVAVVLDPLDIETGGGRAARTDAVVIETNVDDVTPEVVGHVIDRALASGAADAWATPIVMKKSRPAHMISVLCAPERVDELADLLARETGTLGYRLRHADKVELPRHVESVDVDGHAVRIKVGPHGAKAEHDDVARVADVTGRSHRDVAAEALARFRSA